MITITNGELTIRLKDNAPEELRVYAMKAITAAMRWYAKAKDKGEEDAEHLIVLANLQDALTEE